MQLLNGTLSACTNHPIAYCTMLMSNSDYAEVSMYSNRASRIYTCIYCSFSMWLILYSSSFGESIINSSI